MQELSLEEINDWYIGKLNNKYVKHKKSLKKLLKKVEKSVIELKHSVDQMRDRKDQVELDEKTAIFLDRFYSKTRESVNNLIIPDDPMAEDVKNLIDEIKKLFINMNEAGRKNIPRFAEQFKTELTSIDMNTRKISEQMAKVDAFIRRKYGAVKEAESLIKKTPRLQTLVERIANAKTTVDSLQDQKSETEETLKDLEEKLIEIENNPLFQEKSKCEKTLVNLRMKFDEKIKFKKALKKLKKKVEKSGSYKGITPSQVKKYASNPVPSIIAEGENHPQLTDFLVQLRYLLESDSGALQLKNDVKDRTLVNIEKIVSDGILKPLVKDYIEVNDRVKELDRLLEKEHLSSQMTEIKERISDKTQQLEHVSNDLKYKTSEYRNLLEKLKSEREEIQSKIKEYVNEDVKINITLSY